MHFSMLVGALVALQFTTAHTVFTTLFVDDVSQGDGTCVRMPMTPQNATWPVNDLASDDMACGYDGTKGVARVCLTNRASNLSFQFREYPDASQPGVIDTSHKGPCAVYMKNTHSPINDTAVGDGWFKIYDEGYNSTTSQWCTERLMQNEGLLSVTIPDNLAGGYYLIRPELLSLHQSDKIPPNPQFYTGCAQVFLDSSASSLPSDTVSIPGYVNITDSEVLFNIYEPKFPYVTPGPAVYQVGNTETVEINGTRSQTQGGLLRNTVLTNANWMGVELNAYSDADGCEAAAVACWSQATTCYSQAPPTGSKNCPIWESKCQGIRNACNANINTGPPNAGKVLTPSIEARAVRVGIKSNEVVTGSPETVTALTVVSTTLLGVTSLPASLVTGMLTVSLKSASTAISLSASSSKLTRPSTSSSQSTGTSSSSSSLRSSSSYIFAMTSTSSTSSSYILATTGTSSINSSASSSNLAQKTTAPIFSTASPPRPPTESSNAASISPRTSSSLIDTLTTSTTSTNPFSLTGSTSPLSTSSSDRPSLSTLSTAPSITSLSPSPTAEQTSSPVTFAPQTTIATQTILPLLTLTPFTNSQQPTTPTLPPSSEIIDTTTATISTMAIVTKTITGDGLTVSNHASVYRRSNTGEKTLVHGQRERVKLSRRGQRGWFGV